MNEDDLSCYNFDYDDWILIKIIRKYYPDLKNKKELSLLACIGWTMKDLGSLAALAMEVETRMTEKNPIWEDPHGYKIVGAAPTAYLLPPEEYIDILSHLISRKIVEQKIIPTKYGLPPRQRLENGEYLVFTNEYMTDEILGNSEALDFACHYFVSSMIKKKLIKNQKEKSKYLCLLIAMLVTICSISDIQTNRY